MDCVPFELSTGVGAIIQQGRRSALTNAPEYVDPGVGLKVDSRRSFRFLRMIRVTSVQNLLHFHGEAMFDSQAQKMIVQGNYYCIVSPGLGFAP